MSLKKREILYIDILNTILKRDKLILTFKNNKIVNKNNTIINVPYTGKCDSSLYRPLVGRVRFTNLQRYIFTIWRQWMTRESVIQRINDVLCCSLTMKPSHNALKQPYGHTDTHNYGIWLQKTWYRPIILIGTMHMTLV